MMEFTLVWNPHYLGLAAFIKTMAFFHKEICRECTSCQLVDLGTDDAFTL